MVSLFDSSSRSCPDSCNTAFQSSRQKLHNRNLSSFPVFPIEIWLRIFSMLSNDVLVRVACLSSIFSQIIPCLLVSDLHISLRNYDYALFNARCIQQLHLEISHFTADAFFHSSLWQLADRMKILRIKLCFPLLHLKSIGGVCAPESLRDLRIEIRDERVDNMLNQNVLYQLGIFKNLPKKCKVSIGVELFMNANIVLQSVVHMYSENLVQLNIKRQEGINLLDLAISLKRCPILEHFSLFGQPNSNDLEHILFALDGKVLKSLSLEYRNNTVCADLSQFMQLTYLRLRWLPNELIVSSFIAANLQYLELAGSIQVEAFKFLKNAVKLCHFVWTDCFLRDFNVSPNTSDFFTLPYVSTFFISFSDENQHLSKSSRIASFAFVFHLTPNAKKLRIGYGCYRYSREIIDAISWQNQIENLDCVFYDIPVIYWESILRHFKHLQTLSLSVNWLSEQYFDNIEAIITVHNSRLRYFITFNDGKKALTSIEPVPEILWTKTCGVCI